MKKIILIALMAIPFLGLAQEISGTGWKLTDSDNDKIIILFEEDKHFTFLNVLMQSGNTGKVYSKEEDTWTLEGGNIIISFNNGYRICSGKLNGTGDYIWGTWVNKNGESGNWSAKLIEF